MKKYFIHFEDDREKVSNNIKKLIKPVGIALRKTLGREINLTVQVFNNAHVTVCARVDGDTELVKIGFARCSTKNNFHKGKGRDYAAYRAEFCPIVVVQLTKGLGEADIYEAILGLTEPIAKLISSKEGMKKLSPIPREVQNNIEAKYDHPKPVKTKWSEEQIKTAKDASFMSKNHSEMGSFVINDNVESETESQV